MSEKVLIGRKKQKVKIPTTVGKPFNWEDWLEEDQPAATSASPKRVGTATMTSTLASATTLDVVDATFVLDDGSELRAAGTLEIVAGKIHHGSLAIQGPGSGQFANSRGNIGVDRINPKRYKIPT
jgi:hypothetical protein